LMPLQVFHPLWNFFFSRNNWVIKLSFWVYK
jgi:hypothetical protein